MESEKGIRPTGVSILHWEWKSISAEFLSTGRMSDMSCIWRFALPDILCTLINCVHVCDLL